MSRTAQGCAGWARTIHKHGLVVRDWNNGVSIQKISVTRGISLGVLKATIKYLIDTGRIAPRTRRMVNAEKVATKLDRAWTPREWNRG